MKLYRYSVMAYEGGRRQLFLEAHEVLRITPKGYRLQGGRFVLRDARKKFAYETEQDAFNGFKARKARQISILTAQLDGAQQDYAADPATAIRYQTC